MFFEAKISTIDPQVSEIIKKEANRQRSGIQLIASENFASAAVLEAQGSVFTNKYAEGYPGKRYYCGCEYADQVERLAIERICKLFNSSYANVQPHSGSQANQAVFFSLLKPGDTILGFSLASGGHLTHGSSVNLSGKWFNAIHYTVRRDDFEIDMDEVRELAKKHSPKLIIAGASAYAKKMDFPLFREIADEVGAYLLADMAHYAGLIAAGEYPSPFPYVDIMTSTTHKTLRGPRGAIILTNSEELIKKINSAIFPGLQGGPQMHAIAAKAVAFGEALAPEFKDYIRNVIKNAKVLAKALEDRGFVILSGGTETHIVMVDLRTLNLKGNTSAAKLESAGIICNKNAIPFDEEKPFVTSGLRFGSPAETTRGMRETEFSQIGEMIADLLSEKISVDEAKVAIEELTKKYDFYNT
ncbi:serine hydroxymethyltransferase family protein [Neorickettsia helminthoeca str. Oregon]|uniref:Serine hydroxymethyltransferase n=1 Tax=Neorickettsia helminthoeca str. Oregon TaxID=1286528 RepID=X5HLB5_9RICK|nr:serine hydroxymethyltransferase [Neorickettsia helminthoeca]AHX11165.1 serine hydroxymethyltransferase family protein [Neorickettsia helminthoeca str. Oregon]